MAISFPLTLPQTIGIERISIRQSNSVATSSSPFTYKQQVISHGGERWEADVAVATANRDLSAPWKAFLASLRGPTGTFLMGDPDYKYPQGSISSATLSGAAGSSTADVTMTGSLLAGDYIQLGTGPSAKLHMVLADQTGDGQLELWPTLRSTYTDEPVIFENPVGMWRLQGGVNSWDIDNRSQYAINFTCVEAL